jgi:hypothetical protein
MKKLWASAIMMACAMSLSAQVIITDRDMFNEPGLYWRGYATGADQPVSALIGDIGGPQLWDFTNLPKNRILRFDYLEPAETGVAGAFPNATVVERKTDESTSKESFLFLEKVAAQGRRVYGVYDDGSIFTPEMVFSVPIIDFPAQIRFGDTWSTATSYEFWLKEFEELAPMIMSVVERYEVDAWGILDLPGVGFGDALRVNCLVEWNTLVDLEGTGNYETASTDYSRSYFFLRSGLGIAAQITSTQEASPPGNNFNTALEFVTLFETNKEPAAPCDVPFPVTDLRLSFSTGTALLKWTLAECANSYRVEYATQPGPNAVWTELGVTTGNFYQDKPGSAVESRFYRVISLP